MAGVSSLARHSYCLHSADCTGSLEGRSEAKRDMEKAIAKIILCLCAEIRMVHQRKTRGECAMIGVESNKNIMIIVVKLHTETNYRVTSRTCRETVPSHMMPLAIAPWLIAGHLSLTSFFHCFVP